MKLRSRCGVGRGWWSSCWPTPSAALWPQCCLTLLITDRSDICRSYLMSLYSIHKLSTKLIFFPTGWDPEQDNQEVRAGTERPRPRATHPGRGWAKWGRWWCCWISFYQLLSFSFTVFKKCSQLRRNSRPFILGQIVLKTIPFPFWCHSLSFQQLWQVSLYTTIMLHCRDYSEVFSRLWVMSGVG